MGNPRSEYVGRPSAAKLLGVSRETLTAYVKRGLLTPRYFEDRPRVQLFRRSDLKILRTTLAQRTRDVAELETLTLMALSSARRAEARLEQVFATLGLDVVPIGRDPDSIRLLYREAQKGAGREQLDDANWLRHWGGCFFSMDEVYLELVERVTGDPEPWKRFLDFASDVTRAIYETDAKPLAAAEKFFQAGRGHLRHVGYMYCYRTRGREVAGVVFDGRAKAVDELAALLG